MKDQTDSSANADGASEAQFEAMKDALDKFRQTAPESMALLMQMGRNGLLLADRIHQADTAARIALTARGAA